MEKRNFNKDWICYRRDEKKTHRRVCLPHDAMQLDEKAEDSPSGVNNGWYQAKDYVYSKIFKVPEAERSLIHILEFEGVYHRAEVYLNGYKIAAHRNGYTGFYVDCSRLIRYGEENQISVFAMNSDQPNCRWYSGTGIYRPVWLYCLPQKHIVLDSIRITTTDYASKEIRIQAAGTEAGMAQIEILEEDKCVHVVNVQTCLEAKSGTHRIDVKLRLENARVWSADIPVCYRCRIQFGEDVQEVRFGIRQVACSSKHGLTVNGERVFLRGACIHQDNGLLGVRAYDFAEERKIALLKKSGFNAVRCAHNPCSKALLDACDRLGMYVMDEYTDMWYMHKTRYDYADALENSYPEDLRSMVEKDYNHPSVILYSTGNEVGESAQRRGIALSRKMTGHLHQLDGTRPVTCGINIFFNFLSSVGLGVYSDRKAEQAARNPSHRKTVGSEFFNRLAGIFGSGFMKFAATLPPCDWKTKGVFETLDVAGYNYGIKRYQRDLKKYPDRIILGTETFCEDAALAQKLGEKHERVIGDFVWAGMDYLGELGVGAWEYKEYAPDFSHGPGWVSAGSGRLDLTGKELPEMSYMRVAWGLDCLGIGVIPVPCTKEAHSPSCWKMSNAIESWSWEGCEGYTAKVEVYSRAAYVELFLNGESIGRKRPDRNYRACFTTEYRSGVLTAAAYDEEGKELAKKTLKTAGRETLLTLEPEKTRVQAEEDLCYVRMRYTDKNGITKPLIRGEICVKVEGGELLAAGSACPYYPDSYLSDNADTYYGEAMAIVRPHGAGKVIVTAESPFGSARTEIVAC